MLLQAKHIPKGAKHITLTGGEPFVLGKDIFILLKYIRDELPYTSLQILTNGRIFASNSELQNRNRPSIDGTDSYEVINEKLPRLKEANINIGAIQTTTRYSLEAYKEIVDEYIQNEFDTLFIRPLTRLGKASEAWDSIGYTPEEFVEFYGKVFDYIVEKNKDGTYIAEGHAVIFLNKILNSSPEDYMDLRSPCGGVVGQMAYYYDGNIYTCDEGRMLSEMGNDAFLLGNVYNNDYESIVNSDSCKAILGSSCLECIPECCDCVYHPYCGVCPVVNLALDGDIFPRIPSNDRCRIYRGILDKIFAYLYRNDDKEIEILKSWIY